MSSEMPDSSATVARNLELKVAVDTTDLRSIRETLIARGAATEDYQEQEDIYFAAPDGRLKLRMISSARSSAELIGYRRGDVASSRWSSYRILPMTVAQGEALVAVLEQVMPVWVRVRKRREVFLIGATRIHLDSVEELGEFLELETVLGAQVVDDAQREHQRMIDFLGLASYPVVAGSYSDLLAAQQA